MLGSRVFPKFFQYFSSVALKNSNTISMNIIKIDNLNNQKYVNCAVNCLLEGSVIALPTDTIYGLACLAQNDKAVQSIYRIKKRRSDKPLAICVSNIEDIYIWGKVTVPSELLRTLLPGPVTLIFERSESLNSYLNPDTNLVGIRIPNYPFIREVVSKCGSPIALTSANITCEKSPLKIGEFKEIWDQVAKVFDGGTLGNSQHCRKGSTIVDLSIPGCYKVIRKGSAFANTIKTLQKFDLKKINL